MGYKGIYKCSLCGKEYARCSVPTSRMVTDQFIGLTTSLKAKQQIDFVDMHSCDNGDFGLADFIGFKKEE